MLGEAEPVPDQAVEVTHEEVGQVEAPERIVLELLEAFARGEELVAVGALEHLDTLLGADPGEMTTCAAVGVPDEDAVAGRSLAGARDARPDRLGDLARSVVEDRRQALDLDVEPVPLGDRLQLARQSSAGDDERSLSPGHLHGDLPGHVLSLHGSPDDRKGLHEATDGPAGSGEPRRAATSSLAVSAATAASRQ